MGKSYKDMRCDAYADGYKRALLDNDIEYNEIHGLKIVTSMSEKGWLI